jgi:hypothetical protein
LFFAIAVGSVASRAAQIFPVDCDLVLVGEIKSQDDFAFRKELTGLLLEKCTGPKIYIYSPGGDLSAAIAIGRQIHFLHLETVAPTLVRGFVSEPDLRPRNGPRRCHNLPGSAQTSRREAEEVLQNSRAVIDALKNHITLPKVEVHGDFDPLSVKGDPNCTCASACFFIWAAGSERKGDVIQVHRPYFNPALFARLNTADAETAYQKLADEARTYLRQVGVQDGLIDRMFNIDSQHGAYLTAEDLKLLQAPAYLVELKFAKCGREPQAGDDSVNALARKVAAQHIVLPGDMNVLSPLEKALIIRRAERNLCWQKAQAQSRQEAISSYVKESDR